MKIIQQIEKIVSDTILIYDTSKLPRFIKRHTVRKMNKETLELINRLMSNNTVTVQLLLEYFDYISSNYPPNGKYRHIKSIKHNRGVITMVIPIKEDKEFIYAIIQPYKVYANPEEKTGSMDVVGISISWSIEGRVVASDQKTGIEEIIFDPEMSPELPEDPHKGDARPTLWNIAYFHILDDITELLKEIVRRLDDIITWR